jgi:hypothetical protein
MRPRPVVLLAVMAALAAAGCRSDTPGPDAVSSLSAVPTAPATFRDDLAFLEAHTPVVVLSGADGRAHVAVAPGYQGRVMTSTAAGLDGPSYGYVHRPVIETGRRQPHMTVVGGEDRFWLGPEGGPFALYFAPGTAFDADDWQVPEPIDWGGWPVVARRGTEVAFRQPMTLTNYAGTTFDIEVDRTIRLLDGPAIAHALGRDPAGLDVVAYESDNRITNRGRAPWRPETGLVSIWILGMLRPGPQTTVVIPYRPGAEADLGPVVNDAYFGAQPPDRLRVGPAAIFFRGDGTHRGKIGVPRARARDVAGSYDPDRGLLTVVQFTVPDAPHGYVNSMWADQKEPYGGDVINSYNDGPLGPGQPPLGPFYEIESSSPAAALEPGAFLRHLHRTTHLQGPEEGLDAVARSLLGVSLQDIRTSLP